VITESLFYPALAVAMLLAVRSLERPTAGRQVAVVAALLCLCAIRAQAVTLLAAYVTAVALFAWSDGSWRDTGRRFLTTWGLLALIAAAVLAFTGGHPARALGSYGVLVRSYDVWGLAKWLVWTLASLTFSVAVVPLLLLPLAIRRLLRSQAGATARAFAAVAAAATAWTVIATTVISASPFGLDRPHERNLFYVTPLLLVASATVLARPARRATLLVAATGAVLAAITVAFPARLALADVVADAPTARLWRSLDGTFPDLPTRVAVVGTVIVLTAIVLLSRRALLPVALVVIVFWTVGAQMTRDRSALPGGQAGLLAWVDHALPRDARATVLYAGLPPRDCRPGDPNDSEAQLALWTEFFNVKVDRALHLFEDNAVRGIRSTPARIGRDGLVVVRGRPLRAGYVVTDGRVRLTGRELARFDPAQEFGVPAGESYDRLTLWQTPAAPRVLGAGALEAASRREPDCA
jgi:hypothetical protein